MSGRVYGMPGESGVTRNGMGCRFFTHTGEKIPFVSRVAFEADADEGMAAVTAAYTVGGQPVADFVHGGDARAVRVTFRTWVRAVPKGQPDPARTPDAVLWNQNGHIIRLDRDPLPDAAVEALNRAGHELAGATHQ